MFWKHNVIATNCFIWSLFPASQYTPFNWLLTVGIIDLWGLYLGLGALVNATIVIPFYKNNNKKGWGGKKRSVNNSLVNDERNRIYTIVHVSFFLIRKENYSTDVMENLTGRIVRARCTRQTGIMWLYNTRESHTTKTERRENPRTNPAHCCCCSSWPRPSNAQITPQHRKWKCEIDGHYGFVAGIAFHDRIRKIR